MPYYFFYCETKEEGSLPKEQRMVIDQYPLLWVIEKQRLGRYEKITPLWWTEIPDSFGKILTPYFKERALDSEASVVVPKPTFWLMLDENNNVIKASQTIQEIVEFYGGEIPSSRKVIQAVQI